MFPSLLSHSGLWWWGWSEFVTVCGVGWSRLCGGLWCGLVVWVWGFDLCGSGFWVGGLRWIWVMVGYGGMGVLVVKVQWWHEAVVMAGFRWVWVGFLEWVWFWVGSNGVAVVVGWVVAVMVPSGCQIGVGLVVADTAWFWLWDRCWVLVAVSSGSLYTIIFKAFLLWDLLKIGFLSFECCIWLDLFRIYYLVVLLWFLLYWIAWVGWDLCG